MQFFRQGVAFRSSRTSHDPIIQAHFALQHDDESNYADYLQAVYSVGVVWTVYACSWRAELCMRYEYIALHSQFPNNFCNFESVRAKLPASDAEKPFTFVIVCEKKIQLISNT